MAMLGYHDPNYKKNFNGCNVHFPHYFSLDEVANLEVGIGDVVICGFPKSGSVWFCSVVGMILNDADPAFLTTPPAMEFKVPFLEFCTPLLEKGYRGIDAVKKMPGNRLFFSHLKFDLLPRALLSSGAKIIYKTRNPRDSLISLHHHHLARSASQYHGTLDDMVNSYCEDTVPFGPYFDHMASFWKERASPNILYTSYEAMHRDPKGTIRQIAKFLGKTLIDNQVATIADYTTFAAMKENPMVNRVDKVTAGVFDFNIAPFMRKGTPGGYKDDLTPEQIEKLDRWIATNKTRDDLREMPSLQDY